MVKVDIVNMGLNHLGVRPITSLDEGTKPALAAKLIIDGCIDAVLRAHSWNFAGKTEVLASIANQTVPGWSYLYAQPAGCLFVRKVFSDTSVKNPAAEEYKALAAPLTNQKAIATDANPGYIEYTFRVTDPNLYDTAFIEALSYKIAAELAQPLTGNATLRADNLNIYRDLIAEARRTNLAEGYVKPVRTSSYLDAR